MLKHYHQKDHMFIKIFRPKFKNESITTYKLKLMILHFETI